MLILLETYNLTVVRYIIIQNIETKNDKQYKRNNT